MWYSVAHMRFKNAVHAHEGTEKEKIAAAKLLHPRCSSHPASPARPNDDRGGSCRAAPATLGRTSVTKNASSTVGSSDNNVLIEINDVQFDDYPFLY